jgi:hypothetical protein
MSRPIFYHDEEIFSSQNHTSQMHILDHIKEHAPTAFYVGGRNDTPESFFCFLARQLSHQWLMTVAFGGCSRMYASSLRRAKCSVISFEYQTWSARAKKSELHLASIDKMQRALSHRTTALWYELTKNLSFWWIFFTPVNLYLTSVKINRAVIWLNV